jgi:two-component system response regulator MtrA
MEQRILLVEDDPSLGAQIVEHLRKTGFATTWWREGKPLTPDVASGVRLLILDLMLPGTYGMDILKKLRAFSDVPVMILSARNGSADKFRALKLGADDYLTKPFWPDELVERVRARLRRPSMRAHDEPTDGHIRIDKANRAVYVGARDVQLTRVEFDLLTALLRRTDQAVTRQWLVENVLDPDRDGTERTLDVHVSRLRKKLGPEKLIETVWGIGYRLRTGART